jgi:predicted RNA binding protein YcfA (HicA-like mRNA interferase family)
VRWAISCKSSRRTTAKVEAVKPCEPDAEATLRWRTMSLMPMKVREVIRLLEKRGWVEMRSRGSHRQFKHPDQAVVITVPGNDGKELAPGTLNAILKKAGLK